MQIKSVIIDNIYYINFITFDISTLFLFFFLDLPCWNWDASYMPLNTVLIHKTQCVFNIIPMPLIFIISKGHDR